MTYIALYLCGLVLMYSHINLIRAHYDIEDILGGRVTRFADTAVVYWLSILAWPVTVAVMGVLSAFGYKPDDWYMK